MIELLDLIARWVHVIAGIMWVGNSMLFNWLDRNLVAPKDALSYGNIWLLHSGAFYEVEKNRGRRKPQDAGALTLHWFKWQAYTTWLSGAALLVVVYYFGGRALLVDPAVSSIAPSAGVWIAVGTIVAAWAAYEIIWRALGTRAPRVAGVLSIALLGVAIELLLATLSARAAFVHVGAMLGTIMAGNVAFTIMPSQRELVSALEQGRPPSQEIADRAKTRSIHNNYITFPVIALMLSAHFPSLYASRVADVALWIILAGGAGVRHILNVRYTLRSWKPALAGLIAATAAALLAVVQWDAMVPKPQSLEPLLEANAANTSNLSPPTFEEVQRIMDRRCAACHSATPSDVSLGVMPGGIAFDTPAQIRALVERIEERAVKTKTMPPANKTRMSDAERTLVARWIAGQER